MRQTSAIGIPLDLLFRDLILNRLELHLIDPHLVGLEIGCGRSLSLLRMYALLGGRTLGVSLSPHACLCRLLNLSPPRVFSMSFRVLNRCNFNLRREVCQLNEFLPRRPSRGPHRRRSDNGSNRGLLPQRLSRYGNCRLQALVRSILDLICMFFAIRGVIRWITGVRGGEGELGFFGLRSLLTSRQGRGFLGINSVLFRYLIY